MVKKSDITKAYLNVGKDSGAVILQYESEGYNKKVYRVEYGSTYNPETGSTELSLKNDYKSVYVENEGIKKVPKFVIGHAKQTLTKYINKARSGDGSTRNGGVEFTHPWGVKDDWTPEK